MHERNDEVGDTTMQPDVKRARHDVPTTTTNVARNPFSGHPYSDSYAKLLETRQTLPVFAQRTTIQETVRTNQVTLLVGETGSGKTTQVPHLLAELDPVSPGVIACTQPRRIAAISVAARVAAEMDVTLGQQVGYQVRFQTCRSPLTKVLYLTDGMMVREAMHDGALAQYSVLVVDEAHERTVDTDVVLGLLKGVCAQRPEFRLVVMSATLDVGKIRSFFPGAAFLHVSGRMFDVSITYAPEPVRDYVEASVACVQRIHHEEAAGDVLCFLTGESEIEQSVKLCRNALGACVASSSSSSELGTPLVTRVGASDTDNSVPQAKPSQAVVLPLYGSLSLEEQQKVFRDYPPDVRKIIFATNIAETSLTIDGIVYVVDCGYQKQSLYQSSARVDYLLPAVISKASADQRKGRAGRTRPGKCFRMFTQDDFASFPDFTHPEILQSNVTGTLLSLLKIGVPNPMTFPFIDMPSDESMSEAFYQLLYWGAVDDQLRLTEFGTRMAELPVDPPLACMLLKAPKHGCSADVAAVAAMFEAGQVFLRPPQRGREADLAHAEFVHPAGDHVTLFNVFHAFYRTPTAAFCWSHFLRFAAMQRAMQVYTQLRQLLSKHRVPISSKYNPESGLVDTVALRKAILEGYFTQVAYSAHNTDVFVTLQDRHAVRLHPRSFLRRETTAPLPRWILYTRLEVQGEQGMFARTASPVEPEWLIEVSAFYSEPTEIEDLDAVRELIRVKEAMHMQ